MCALYAPPTENVPIFDSSNFNTNDTPLTIETGLDYFLAYPQAQGTEYLQSTYVVGDLTTFGDANFDNVLEGSVRSLALQPLASDSSTKIPTTAWVQSAISSIPSSTLSQVLINGNSAGTTDINMNENDITTVDTIKSKVFNLRDFTTGLAISSALYQVGVSMAIENTVPSSFMILKTANSGGTLVNCLTLSTGQITSGVPDPLLSDSSNKLATTGWVTTKLSTYVPTIPESIVRRAYISRSVTNTNFNNLKVIVSSSGITGGWNAHEFFTLRVSCQQQFNPYSVGDAIFYQANRSTTCDLNIYPRRFFSNWLNDAGGYGGGPSGVVTTNQISGTDSLFNISVTAGKTPYGRQFWGNNLVHTLSGVGSTNNTGANSYLFICGVDSNVDRFAFFIVNPNFPSVSQTNYGLNFSIELINFPPSTSGKTISTSGFDINFSYP